MKKSKVLIPAILAVVLAAGCSLSEITAWWNASVSGFTASQGTHPNKIVLSWNAFEGADYYELGFSPTANGVFQYLSYHVAGTSMEILVGVSSYYYYYNEDFQPGVHYFFQIRAYRTYEGGIGSTNLLAAPVEGWSDETAYAGSWVQESQSVSSTGGSLTVISGIKLQFDIDAAAKTVTFRNSTYNTGTGQYVVTSGAVFSFEQAVFQYSYSANVYLRNLRQTRYYDTGTSAFVDLTTQYYGTVTGGTDTRFQLLYDPSRDMLSLENDSSMNYDGDDDGFTDETINSGNVFYREI